MNVVWCFSSFSLRLIFVDLLVVVGVLLMLGLLLLRLEFSSSWFGVKLWKVLV